jgi:hypothetical protein
MLIIVDEFVDRGKSYTTTSAGRIIIVVCVGGGSRHDEGWIIDNGFEFEFIMIIEGLGSRLDNRSLGSKSCSLAQS